MSMTQSSSAEAGPTVLQIAAAVGFALSMMVLGYVKIGVPPVVIVGGSSIAGLALWLRTYRNGSIAPEIILPPFLLTVAGLEVHMGEEYLSGFGPAMSRLFDISWSEFGFLLIFTFVGPVLYALTALGLFWRVRLAGFLAWFIFIGPGVAEFTHFIFPLIKPAIGPHDVGVLTEAVSNGRIIANMQNYWFQVTGRYYFPGMYTAILPMIPGIYGIRAVLRADRERRHRRDRTTSQPIPASG